MIADVAGPLNGDSTRKAMSTAGHKPNRVPLQRSSESSASPRDSAPRHPSTSYRQRNRRNIVPTPCASSCRTERIPRRLFFKSYSCASSPVTEYMLDRLTDNLEIWSTGAGEPRRRQEQDRSKRAPAAHQGANHGSRNNRLCRNGPHGRTDGRAPARCRLLAMRLRPASEATKPLVARGARLAKSPAEVASSADIVLASLPTPDIVKGRALGPEERGRKGLDGPDRHVHHRARRREWIAGARSQKNIASRSMRRSVAASQVPRTARLQSWSPARSRPMEALEPTLKNFGKLFYVGEKPGAAQTMKLANNLLAAAAPLPSRRKRW